MSILFLVPTADLGASSRYRVYQYKEYLQQKNVKFEILPFMDNSMYTKWKAEGAKHLGLKVMVQVLKRLQVLIRINSFDTVFIHRDILPFGPMLIEWLITKMNVKVVVDIDDAVFSNEFEEITTKNNRWLYIMKYGKRYNLSFKNVDKIICGNEFLADYCRKLNKNVIVIPTVVDTSSIPVKKDFFIGDKITIGWIGNPGNSSYLNDIIESFITLSLNFPNKIRFKLIGSTPIENNKTNILNIEYVNWDLQTEYKELSSCDIGIMPLKESEWSKGKCGLKLLQYGAVGIPSLASSVGVNSLIIKDYENGFLIKNNADWLKYLTYLVENPVEIKRMGNNARLNTEKDYSLLKWQEVFLNEII